MQESVPGVPGSSDEWFRVPCNPPVMDLVPNYCTLQSVTPMAVIGRCNGRPHFTIMSDLFFDIFRIPEQNDPPPANRCLQGGSSFQHLSGPLSGEYEIRTRDLLHAMQAH